MDQILIRFYMSILLIGQKNLPHPEQYYFPKEERIAGRQANKIKQMKYRTQLMNQIEQNKQRKSREKQIDQIRERMRQQALLGQLKRKYQNTQTKQKQWYRISQDNKVSSLNLPYLHYPYYYYNPKTYESEYQRSYSKPQESQIRPNHRRAIKTQNSVYNPQRDQLQVIQNPQERVKQLKDYGNRKFKQVYNLLDRSIDVFYNQNPKPEELHKKRSSRLKKLNEKIKINKNNFAHILEQDKEFYELPFWSTKKPIKQSKVDSDWQSWFVQQKLKGLQQQKRNQHLKREVQDHLYRLQKRIKSKLQ